MRARKRDEWTRQAEGTFRAQGDRRPDVRGLGDLDGSIAWAIQTLSDQAMPSEEIGAILSSDDPAVVRRYLEVHRERLEEGLANQQFMLGLLEPLLVARSRAAGRHSPRTRMPRALKLSPERREEGDLAIDPRFRGGSLERSSPGGREGETPTRCYCSSHCHQR
jgi:hypothetical protein